MTGPVADTLYGKLQGTQSDGVNIWRGIPFAAPPVGELRFRAPQPPEPWNSIREAMNSARSAISLSVPAVPDSEVQLLNIPKIACT